MIRLLAWLRFAIPALLLIVAAGARAEDSLEYAIKATYLYKFAPFIQWPETAFQSPDSSIDICVSGADPFGAVLDRAAAGQRIGGRPIAIRHIASLSAGSHCHIVFISGSADQSVLQGLDAVRGLPVLTVTDNAVDAANRGIVNFVIVDSRVRFEIDAREAAQNHIVISSKLLSLGLRPGQEN